MSASAVAPAARRVLCYHCHTLAAPSHIGACPDREKPSTCAVCARDHFTLRCPLLRRRHVPLCAEEAPQRTSRRRRKRDALRNAAATAAASHHSAVATEDPALVALSAGTDMLDATLSHDVPEAGPAAVRVLAAQLRILRRAQERVRNEIGAMTIALQEATRSLGERLTHVEAARAAAPASPRTYSAAAAPAPASAAAAPKPAAAAAPRRAKAQLSGYFTRTVAPRVAPASPRTSPSRAASPGLATPPHTGAARALAFASADAARAEAELPLRGERPSMDAPVARPPATTRTTKRSSAREQGDTPQSKAAKARKRAPAVDRDLRHMLEALTAPQHDADADDLQSDGDDAEHPYYDFMQDDM
jgi:hypothetical protein